jgi:hypothetical protein
MSYPDLPDLISVSTHIDHNIRMQMYDSNCTSRMNWFDLAGTPCLAFKPKPLNTFESIKALLAATFDEEPLKDYFSEQSTVPSPWNTYSRDGAREGGRLDIYDSVFRPNWTQYSGAYCLFPCNPKDTCHFEGHNSARTHSTVGHIAVAATTAKSLRIRLIVVVPPTPTPSDLDAYNWHW